MDEIRLLQGFKDEYFEMTCRAENKAKQPGESSPDSRLGLLGMPALLVLAGSFRSLSLFLLAFSPVDRSLRLAQHVPAFGPHQYLAVSHCTHTVYTTTWADPPALHSWAVDRNASSLSPINSVPITATSSYIAIPAPYTHVYSTGGPAGEVHLLNHPSGAIGSKIQEFLFVPDDQLSNADKTRTALVCFTP